MIRDDILPRLEEKTRDEILRYLDFADDVERMAAASVVHVEEMSEREQAELQEFLRNN